MMTDSECWNDVADKAAALRKRGYELRDEAEALYAEASRLEREFLQKRIKETCDKSQT